MNLPPSAPGCVSDVIFLINEKHFYFFATLNNILSNWCLRIAQSSRSEWQWWRRCRRRRWRLSSTSAIPKFGFWPSIIFVDTLGAIFLFECVRKWSLFCRWLMTNQLLWREHFNGPFPASILKIFFLFEVHLIKTIQFYNYQIKGNRKEGWIQPGGNWTHDLWITMTELYHRATTTASI